jgi:hypothetical protein
VLYYTYFNKYVKIIRVLPLTAVCKTVPEGKEVKARGALPSTPTVMPD